MRRPGIEPGPLAWKARILTIELSTRHSVRLSQMVERLTLNQVVVGSIPTSDE